MFKLIGILIVMVLIVFQTIDARMEDYFQPPVPYKGCCITRGMVSGHAGVDIACNGGSIGVAAMGDSDLVAKCDGQSIGKNWRPCGQGGNYVLLKYIVGIQPLYVYYYHLAPGSVTKANIGTRIRKGQQVGKIGTTGYSTGIHLDVTAQKTPPTDHGKYNPPSIIDFRNILQMNQWRSCWGK